jgi:hypothetical protein
MSNTDDNNFDNNSINNNNSNEDNENNFITKEMFLRDLLQEQQSNNIENNNDIRIKKKKNSGKNNSNYKNEYKVFDNRDTMPYAVKLQTPDPYTHPEVKRKNATKLKKRNSAIEEQIVSRVMLPSSSASSSSTDNVDNTMTLLGEYSLDKHTTTGDSLLINNIEYKVVRHRCLYKYAGGQRFVMIKKILEVKEISRIQTEEYLLQQFQNS